MKRKILALSLAVMFFASPITTKSVFANSEILYTDKDVQTITDGLTFEKVQRLYKSGWKDFYVLTADMTNSNISFEILDSKTEHGLKKNVGDLVKENDVVAGINADFFGAGNPTSSMGQVIENNKVVEAQNYYNGSSNKYAGAFLDKYGNIFIDYLKSNLRLYNNNVSLELQSKNKITDFKKPVYFDRTVMTSTKDLDKRRKELFKIVVDNKTIIKKAGASEVVDIPENGYVIVMDKATASNKLALFNVGDPLYFDESYKFLFREGKNISEIEKGISAGGEILRNGKNVSVGMSIAPKSRNPRSALGINKEKNKLILIAVDGRGQSVGATHNEMAQLLLEYGAYDAIHLDGGGSTTVALREEGDTETKIVNDFSDKSPRLVPNGVGIKTKNQTGDVASILLKLENEDEKIVAGQTYNLKITGLDANKNPVPIDFSRLTMSFNNEADGTVNGQHFLCNVSGDLTINASYDNGATGQINFKVQEPFNAILPKAIQSSLSIGENTPITISILNKDGFSKPVDISQVSFSVDNNAIGYVQNSTFYATGEGVANVTATYGEFSAIFTIAVGDTPKPLESFEKERKLKMLYYPNDNSVTGGSGITNSTFFDGANSLLISYSFKENTPKSQASYVSFEDEPIIINSGSAIQMQVKGDGSGNLLKLVLKDKNNKERVLPILNSMTSTDWVTTKIMLPTDLEFPIKLDKIYIGSENTTVKEQGTIFIDAIQTVTKRDDGGELISGYKDYLNQDIKNVPIASGEEDINVFGQTASKPNYNSKQVLVDAINQMKVNARAIVFAGETNTDGINAGVPTVSWNNKYSTTNTNNLSIINLATKSGIMRTESPDQWRWLQSYLDNQSKNNILITMDKNIWDKQNSLKGTRENTLFHKILTDFVQRTGKNVIVVSAVSNKTNVYVKDGVRYITLNGLTNNNPDNLTNYKYLKIRASQNDLKYEIVNLYN